MHVLVTGAAGFIGFHLCRALLAEGNSVVGLDNINDYYSPELKMDRVKILAQDTKFRFVKQDLSRYQELEELFAKEKFTHVVNLAAQAGVRYSLLAPQAYIQSNLNGFGNLLECCRNHPVEHLVFASSSSVYGLNTNMPFSASGPANHPASLYAATKKSNEMMAHSYSHLFRIPCTGLRFFTVYGPWGRPDMALFSFTRDILAGKPINVFNNGEMQRDFTYIDDITNGVMATIKLTPQPDPAWDSSTPAPDSSSAPFRLYNIGNNNTVNLMYFIEIIEKSLSKKAVLNFMPMQPGDVYATYADIEPLKKAAGFSPKTQIEEGVPKFVEWFRDYYQV